MMQLDAKAVKEKILKFLEEKGPSLPVSIAKRIELNTIFTSAFLSELVSEGKIKISNMKVGGSPLYYTLEKKQMLENFSSFLSNKEREAFELLKSSNYLQDDLQHPAIRVALRSLKDFAVPLKINNKLFWKYFSWDETQNIEVREKKEEIKPKEEAEEIKEGIKEEIKVSKELEELEKLKKELEERNKEIEQIKAEMKAGLEKKAAKKEKGTKKKAVPKKIDENFLNEIKTHLVENNIEIISIECFDSKHAILKIRLDNRETLLFAFNRKKIGESELIKANKKASGLNLPYSILLRGELPSKIKEAIEAYKNLSSIWKFRARQPDLNNNL